MRLLGPCPAAEMECYPVSAMVNSPLNVNAPCRGQVSIFFCATRASCPSSRNV
jgi:hypothetical protein